MTKREAEGVATFRVGVELLLAAVRLAEAAGLARRVDRFVGRVSLRPEGDALAIGASDGLEAAAEVLVPLGGSAAFEVVTVATERLASTLAAFVSIGAGVVGVVVDRRGGSVAFAADGFEASLSAMPIRDGDPRLVEPVASVSEPVGGLVVPVGLDLLAALRFARHAVWDGAERASLRGYLVEPVRGSASLRVVATDGNRLAASAPIRGVSTGPVRLPSRTIGLAEIALGTDAATVEVGPGVAVLRSRGGRASVGTEGLEDAFADAALILEDLDNVRATSGLRGAALATVARLALAHGSDRPATLRVAPEDVSIATVDTLGARSRSWVEAEVRSSTVAEVGISPRFVLDAASAFDPDEVVEVVVRGRFDAVHLVGERGGICLVAPQRLD